MIARIAGAEERREKHNGVLDSTLGEITESGSGSGKSPRSHCLSQLLTPTPPYQ